MKWKKTTEAEYWRLLELLPPAVQTPAGFLVGEALKHNAQNQPMFEAFVQSGKQYFRAEEPMTVAEFKAMTLTQVRKELGL